MGQDLAGWLTPDSWQPLLEALLPFLGQGFASPVLVHELGELAMTLPPQILVGLVPAAEAS